MRNINYHERPILAFWETTRACLLSCAHCRAEAMAEPLPGELSNEEGKQFIQSLLEFGKPYPVLILTGGDVLMRKDAMELVAYAKSLEIPVAMSPSVTPNLTLERMQEMKALGIRMVSISLDGAVAATHEMIRGIPGHFEQTLQTLRQLVDLGFHVQVNTAVMRDNANELAAIAEILKTIGVETWEVFFLVHVGRGQNSHELSPSECEDVVHFLYDASAYDLVVRTVEGPFFRRIIKWRERDQLNTQVNPEQVASHYQLGSLYRELATDLVHRLGDATAAPKAQTSQTRDGKGIVFVSYDGTVYPAGFLPLSLGNIREQNIATIYRSQPVMKQIRNAEFTGRCALCDYKDLCGGSRARAFAHSGDPLAEDPACAYVPTV